jgi:hypothetical protein
MNNPLSFCVPFCSLILGFGPLCRSLALRWVACPNPTAITRWSCRGCVLLPCPSQAGLALAAPIHSPLWFLMIQAEMNTNAGNAVAQPAKESDYILLNVLPQKITSKANILCVHVWRHERGAKLPRNRPSHFGLVWDPILSLLRSDPKDRAFHGLAMSVLSYIYAMKHQVKESALDRRRPARDGWMTCCCARLRAPLT